MTVLGNTPGAACEWSWNLRLVDAFLCACVGRNMRGAILESLSMVMHAERLLHRHVSTVQEGCQGLEDRNTGRSHWFSIQVH